MARLVRAVKRHYTTVIPSGGEAEVECISSGGPETVNIVKRLVVLNER